MPGLELVAYCGLHCGLCAQRGRIPRRAQELRQSMATEGYEDWGAEIPGFQQFWTFLTGLCGPDGACPGCRQGGGPPFCSIRKCARQRQVEGCVFCEDYPCRRVEAIAKGYPTLLADGKRMRQIGVEAWMAEQDDRAKTGFAYADIRCHPYQVPND